MKITDKTYFDAYRQRLGQQIEAWFKAFDFSEAAGDLGYRTAASAVYSSNIEGNTIDLNTFMNLKLAQEKFRHHKEVEEIEDLIAAYEFAQQRSLSEKNLLKAHQILSRSFLINSRQGNYRTGRMGVFSERGLVYLAVEPENVSKEMRAFFEQLAKLLVQKLTRTETFYFASLTHLRFAHIHPFSDGNGRAARLLEKWFLAENLGREAWKLPSEKYYKEHQETYYKTINLGVNFYELDYDRCLPFLEMLPQCLKESP